MSTLYYYYPSKQAVLVDIAESTLTELIDLVGAAVAQHESPADQLRATIRAHVMFHGRRRKEILITDTEIRSLEPDPRRRIIGLRDAYTRLFCAVLDAGKKSGEFSFQDRSVTGNALFGMTNSVATWYDPHGRCDLSDIADSLSATFLHGIANDRGRHRSGSPQRRSDAANQ
ncbi:TetR/AcrR family transcriptional regulator C-terminal domain-containing protein [Mycolicibacterium baixiangningiae]|nr:TetR/AcrR family transcriptional regulator C-terminal domain-containing protein [Mycolicibacterium baixiangningiae]